MQHALYKLCGVHMLLPSGGDTGAIRVTHVWVLRAHLQSITCLATLTANNAVNH